MSLAIHRTDYMLHQTKDGTLELRMIEINVIAAAFAGLSSALNTMYSFSLGRQPGAENLHIPKNEALEKVPSPAWLRRRACLRLLSSNAVSL